MDGTVRALASVAVFHSFGSNPFYSMIRMAGLVAGTDETPVDTSKYWYYIFSPTALLTVLFSLYIILNLSEFKIARSRSTYNSIAMLRSIQLKRPSAMK